MLRVHRANGAVLSISLHEVEDPSPFGVVDIQPGGSIRRFVEKPKREDAPSRLINAGTWIFEPRLAGMLDASTFNRVEDSLFPALCAGGEPVYGFHHQGYWRDIGNPSALLGVNLDMARGLVTSPAVATPADGVFLAENATIEDGAKVTAPAVIGAGTRVASGATVSGSVLWDAVTVESGASVSDSILATGVHVGARARVVDSVVAHRAEIAADANVEHTSIEPAGESTASQGTAAR
jgi:mannose-1-phosphate guanylyltransferase